MIFCGNTDGNTLEEKLRNFYTFNRVYPSKIGAEPKPQPTDPFEAVDKMKFHANTPPRDHGHQRVWYVVVWNQF